MATVKEGFFDRREIVGDSADVPYLVFDAADEAEVKAACEGAEGIPEWIGDLKRKEIEIAERVNATTWRVVARFQKPSYSWPGGTTPDSRFTFDTGGGTQHITQSISTVNRYAPPGKTAPDFGGAIGVTHDNVEGVDITVPVYAFSETHYLADAVVTPAYRGTLFNLTGKVNSASFKGLAAGECLFLGASGSKRGADDWEISFKFAGSPNRTNINVGGITVSSKKGWEYMWVRYADSEDAGANAIVKKPVAVYVEKVYEEGNFAGLGIGT